MTVPKTATKKNEFKISERLGRYHLQSSFTENVNALLRIY